MPITKELWTSTGPQPLWKYIMTKGDIEISLTNLGCTFLSIIVPDKNGNCNNVLLAYETPNEYLQDEWYIGCLAGRVAGRISRASFILDTKAYTLDANDGDSGNHLHGGFEGFNKKIFSVVKEREDEQSCLLQLLFISDHSDQGYPGTLSCTVTIELVADNRVLIEYEGISDRPTFFNPTHHFYFNLSATAEPATAHELYMNAATIIATNAEYIPTGKRTPVENTAYDFRHHRIIGDQTFYNECYVLDKKEPKEVAAQLTDPSSGRSMTITTTFPGIVFYSGDLLRSPFKKSQGICLETQFFPDAPNRPEFPSTRVEPGIKFNHTTQYQFTAALPDLVKGMDFINQ